MDAKECDASGFRIEKTTPKYRLRTVLRALINLCSHLPFIRGRRGPRHRSLQGERFASFMAHQNRRRFDTDLRDAALQGRKMMKLALWIALVGGGAWVAVESAKALAIF